MINKNLNLKSVFVQSNAFDKIVLSASRTIIGSSLSSEIEVNGTYSVWVEVGNFATVGTKQMSVVRDPVATATWFDKKTNWKEARAISYLIEIEM